MTKEYCKMILNDIRHCKNISTNVIKDAIEQDIQPVEIFYISLIDEKAKYTVKFKDDLMLYRGMLI